jgi:hypothetical protein
VTYKPKPKEPEKKLSEELHGIINQLSAEADTWSRPEFQRPLAKARDKINDVLRTRKLE